MRIFRSPYFFIAAFFVLIGMVGMSCSLEAADLLEPGPTLTPSITPTRTTTPTRTPRPSPTLRPTITAAPTRSPAPTEGSRPTLTPQFSVITGQMPPITPASLAEAGQACFADYGFGVSCLDDKGKWKRYTAENSSLSSNLVNGLAFCPDGRLLVAGEKGIDVLDGQKWGRLRSPEFDNFSAVVCDRSGGFWAAHYGGVIYYNGTTWTNHPAENLAKGDAATNLIKELVISPDGSVWAATLNSLAHFDGKDWSVYQQFQSWQDRLLMVGVAVDPQGVAWGAHLTGLVRFDGTNWNLEKPSGMDGVDAISIDSKERVWVASSQGLYVEDNHQWFLLDRSSKNLSSDRVLSVQVDGSGRLWVGTAWGLNVYDGEKWTVYNVHTSGLTSNNIKNLAVQAGGPPLPPLETSEKGQLGGRILVEGFPLSGVSVQLCVEGVDITYKGDTPCVDQPFTRTEITNEIGDFLFKNIPAGSYTLIIERTEGTWRKIKVEGIPPDLAVVKPGKATQLGAIELGSE